MRGRVGTRVGVAVATLVLGSVAGVPLAIGVALCAVAGGFIGATLVSTEFQKGTGIIYEWAEDALEKLSEVEGFFDWAADQI